MITTSLIIVSLLFGIYYALSCMIFGVSLLYLWKPQNETLLKKRTDLKLFSPSWSVIDILLFFSVVCYMILFNHDLPHISDHLLSIIIIGFAAIIIRLCASVYNFYFRRSKEITGLIAWILLITNFIIPISLGLLGIYFITGIIFWRSHSDLILSVTLILGTLANAFAYAWFSLKRYTPYIFRRLCHLCVTLYCIVGAIFLQIAINHSQSHLLSIPYDIYILLIASLAMVELGVWLLKKEYLIWWFLASTAVGSPILWALANRPFILYSKISLFDAYWVTTTAKIVCVSLVIFLLLLVSCFVAFNHLLPARLKLRKLL